MLYSEIAIFLVIVACDMAVVTSTTDPTIISRSEWHARPPKEIKPLTNPVEYVVVHHSYKPAACYDLEDCIKAMQWMQDLHQINNSWADIGYNFAVGSDGRVYEGRGWSRVGAHAPTYNFYSIGICMIGDWRDVLPPEQQITTVHRLIEMGVREGMVMADYKLVGHRQVRTGTTCPGDMLYKELCTWPHYCENPPDPTSLSTHSSPETTTAVDVDSNKLKKRTAL